jgi:putative heme-binding domain-containing protein
LLAVDCAISPKGELVVCCHTGRPDWGNGPKGEGRLFKISFSKGDAPIPVLSWAASETETVVALDHALDAAEWGGMTPNVKITSGKYVAAADRLETMRPGYAVVQMQQRQDRPQIAVHDVRLAADRRSIVIQTAPRVSAVNYAVAIEKQCDLAHDLSGLSVKWEGGGEVWSGWLPHPDFVAAREFTRGSVMHDALWKHVASDGKLTFRARLNPWQMLIPATQPLSQLDYTPEPETVTVVFKSDNTLTLAGTGASIERVSDRESRMTVTGVRENQWPELTLTVATPAKSLDVSFSTTRDPRPRALQIRRFLMPFAQPAPPDVINRGIPEIAGGDWEAGRVLFGGKALCATCHQLRGIGVRVGPELGNLIHRDYASVLKDIADPNATINPDAVGYTVTRRDGSIVIGTRLAESEEELQIAQPGGAVAKLKKSEIASTEPLPVSLMPPGLDKTLSADELRHLMTYLLTDAPQPASVPKH